MRRQRDIREAKALVYLRMRGQASALEIGAAAVRGEAWAIPRRPWKAKAHIGLTIAVALTRDGTVRRPVETCSR